MSVEPIDRPGGCTASGPDDGWWAPALALRERTSGVNRLGGAPDESSQARLDRWRKRYGSDREPAFRRRLADVGLDEAGLLRLLAEPPAALAARTPRPSWARRMAEAVRSAAAPPADTPVPTCWQEAFAWPLRPLVAATVEWTVTRLAPYRTAARLDLSSVVEGFRVDLNHRLVDLAAPTVVAELHAWRDAGRLCAADSRQRFAEFIRRLSSPTGLREFFAKYPVLARLLADTSQFEAEALVSTLTRFATDRADIVRVVLGDTDPGALRVVTRGPGDSHQRGNMVRVLHFVDGARVVYKPRGIGASLALADLVAWLNAAVPRLGLRTPIVHPRGGYGWMEFIAPAPLNDIGAAAAYYRRLGALLALLHVVHATDMHCENIIAVGDQPLVVDAETLFHPTLPVFHSSDPAVQVLARSVVRTAMLPSAGAGADGEGDTSALAGTTGSMTLNWESTGTDQMRPAGRTRRVTEGPSRPRLAGQVVDPADWRQDLLHGFRLGYDAACQDRDRLLSVVRRCADVDVRVVLRPTRRYRALLDAANRPETLRDGLDRDQIFDPLWIEARDRLRRAAAAYEAVDLWAGDIPLFQTQPGSRDVWTSDRNRLSNLLDRPEIERIAETIRQLGDVDRQDQEWIIKATIATRGAVPAHRLAGPTLTNLDAVAAPPHRLLAAACEVADRIVAAGISDGDRVSWLGLEPDDEQRWLLLPTGAGLAHGTLGIALFLAEAARLSGVARYAGIARRALRSYPSLHRTLATQPHLAGAVGCGGLSGLGGMAYGLARLAGLLDDPDLAALAVDTVDLAATAAEEAPPDWRDGVAGCLAAMLAVHRELGLPAAWQLARRCADLLVPLVQRAGPDEPSDGGDLSDQVDLPAAFATGWGGIAYALHRMADACPRYRPAAARALALLPVGPLAPDGDWGWCSGAAGRLLTAAVAGCPPDVVSRGSRAVANRPVARDLSLCHGELGVLDVLIELAGAGHPPAERERHRRAGLVLDAIHRYGPICGTPDEVETPGLLIGLAGIGYGLLRLGFPAQVPSALLLQAAQRGR